RGWPSRCLRPATPRWRGAARPPPPRRRSSGCVPPRRGTGPPGPRSSPTTPPAGGRPSRPAPRLGRPHHDRGAEHDGPCIPPSVKKLAAAGALPGLSCPPRPRPQGNPRVQGLAHRRHEAGQLAGGERETERQVAPRRDVVPELEQIEEEQLKELRVAAVQVFR